MNPSPAKPRRRPLLLATILAALVGGALAPATASAGQYTIYSCDANPPDALPASNLDSSASAFPVGRAFSFATRSMLGNSGGRRCGPGSRGSVRGLVTMNRYKLGGTVARGAKSRYIVRAPGGTRISRLRWAGATQRADCRWTVQVYTQGSGRGNSSIRNRKGRMKDCAGKLRARAAGFTRQRTIARAAGATKFVQVVKCTARTGRKRCSNRAPNFATTTAMTVSIADSTKPVSTLYADNAFTRGAWVSRGQYALNYAAQDNVGVKRMTATFGNGVSVRGSRACDYRGLGGLAPCPSGRGKVNVNTNDLAEGAQTARGVATDSADNSAVSRNGLTVRVDKTAPGAVPTSVNGGEGWRSTNSFTVGWTNAAEPNRAPITAASYKLCPSGGGKCVDSRVAGTNVSQIAGLKLPTEGTWTLRMFRSDAAGNSTAANASQPVTLRLDSTPPSLGFEASSAEDPTKVAVQVNDKVSGLAGGQIEISRVGSGSWQQIATKREGSSRLVGRIDDARLSAGTYAVRAFAHDQANNQASSDKRLDGKPMILKLPLRTKTVMKVGVAKRKTVTERVKARRSSKPGRRKHRKARYRKVRRRITVLRATSRARFRKRVPIAGSLTNSEGQGIAGQRINVYARNVASGERLIGSLRTGAGGRYRFKAIASSSRTLRFAYAGSAKILPTQGEVKLRVPATSSIRVSPHRTVNGGRIKFRGRLGAPFRGKLVELQARLPNKWQTFRTLRTDAKGRWRSGYRFQGTTCNRGRPRVYRFRIGVPTQGGYPFQGGHSPTVKVRVRGSGC